MDAVEAASSLLHTNSFLPDPDPAVICPDSLILALYDEGARRLIGVDHGPRTMYKLPNLNFETALAFTTAAGGRMLLAYQMAQGVRTATGRGYSAWGQLGVLLWAHPTSAFFFLSRSSAATERSFFDAERFRQGGDQ